MYRFFFTYGVAAHLAILAVAPLFLSAFLPPAAVAKTMLWISLYVAVWVFAEPLPRPGEHGRDARRRVRQSNLHDPLFWVLLAVAVLAGLRCLNGGIALSYDAELATWRILPAWVPFLPGTVGDAGFLPFATAIAALLIVQGVRHSLRSSSRLFFLLMAASLAALSVLVLLILPKGLVRPQLLAIPASGDVPSAAMAYGIFAIAGVAGLSGQFEFRWHGCLPFGVLAIGGCLAGCLLTAPHWLALFATASVALVFLYSFVYSCIFLRGKGSGHLQFLALMGMAFAGCAAILWLLLPAAEIETRLAALQEGRLFAEKYWELRETLSGITLSSWLSHMWIGTGLGSFPLDFRFCATESVWAVFPRGAGTPINGWWQLLAERGIVGSVLIVLPMLLMAVYYFRRLVTGVMVTKRHPPLCLIAPLAMAMVIGGGFFDCSLLRSDTIVAVAAVTMASAAAFARKGD